MGCDPSDARIHHRNGDEDHAMKVSWEHAQQSQERVPPKSAITSDQDHRDRLTNLLLRASSYRVGRAP